MAKAAVKTTPVAKKVTRKRPTSKKAKTAVLDKKNKKTTIKQVVKSQREIKYKYPSDIDNQLDRKSWRQKVRGQNKSFLARIAKMKGQEKSKEEVKYKRFRKDHYMVP